MKITPTGLMFENDDNQLMKVTRNPDGDGWIITILGPSEEFWVPTDITMLNLLDKIKTFVADGTLQ